VARNTKETRITVSVNLDGSGASRIDTGLPFLEHMLEQVARHGLIDIALEAKGDLHIDAHHTVEDIGITLGQAIAQAAGDRKLQESRSQPFIVRRVFAVLQICKLYYNSNESYCHEYQYEIESPPSQSVKLVFSCNRFFVFIKKVHYYIF